MKKWIFLGLWAPLVTFAAEGQVRNFSQSLFKELGIRPERIVKTAGKVSIAFKNLRGDAAATYHPLFNRITFHNDLKEGRNNLAPISMLRARSQYAYSVYISTIFHEFGHAEYDTIVEGARSGRDGVLINTFKQQVKPWFKKHFRRTNSQSAVHELYGYYRGEVIETLYSEIDRILMMNGVNIYAKRCFKSKQVKEMALKMSREEFQELFFIREMNRRFRDLIKIRYIFISGKDLDLASVKSDPFKERWYHVIWDQIYGAYELPRDTEELFDHMKKYHRARGIVKNCRGAIWDEFNGALAMAQ